MAADDLEIIELATRADLREWLEQHHETSPSVWLVIYKKGAPAGALRYDDAVEEALCFGWIDGQARRLDETRYRILFTKRRAGSVWSRPNKERVARLTEQGLMRPAGLAAIERAKADGSWEILDLVEEMVEPEDLTAALDANPAARANFDAFPTGSRKLALYWIREAKRPETRATRIAQTVSLSAQGVRPRG